MQLADTRLRVEYTRRRILLNFSIRSTMKRFLMLVLVLAAAPHVSAEVRLWVSATTTNGDLDGGGGARAGADAICDDDANKPTVASSATRAFISIDATDEIQDMPANYGVSTTEVIQRADGTTQIASDWAALLNSFFVNLDNSVDAGSFFVWTGSFQNGAITANTCSNWTSTAGVGQYGGSSQTNQTWIAFANAACSTAVTRLYCLTFTTTAPVSGNAGLIEW